jgi:hypothetical protein
VPDNSPHEPHGLNPTELFALALEGIKRPSVIASPSEPLTVDALQRHLPDYEVLQLVGRGGMGAVYRGRQLRLDRIVAIKVLPPEIAAGEIQYRERFKREARAMAQLKHPGIVAVHDAGETRDGLLYFVMEFVDGTDVGRLLASLGRMAPGEAVRIAANVCDALAYAHERGVVHRDIKPSNVMVEVDGTVKVADFGLAKVASAAGDGLTRSDFALGSPDYIAPESLISGIEMDGRADVYAVGVMLYQMLTEKVPRGRFDPPSRVVPGLDKRLDAIVDKALQTDRDKRYASAIEVKAALEPILTRTLARRTAVASAAGKKSGLPMILAAVLLAALGVGGWIAWKPSAPALPPPEAGADAQKTAGASYPTVSAGGLVIFPAGVWTRMWPAEIEAVRFVKRDGEWGLASEKSVSPPGVKSTRTPLKNVGMRARFRGQRIQADNFPQMNLRTQPGNAGSLNLWIEPTGKTMQLRVTADGKLTKLAEAPLREPLAMGKEYAMEFFAIGDRLIGRIDGQTVTARAPAAPGLPGDLGITSGHYDYLRGFEVLNLDGIPEADALKLAGVFEGAQAPAPSVSLTSPPAAGWTVVDFAGSLVLHNAEIQGGQLHFSNGNWWPLGSRRFRNAAQRVSLIWRENTGNLKLNFGDQTGTLHYAKLNVARTGGQYWQIGYYPGSDVSLTGTDFLKPEFQPGDTVVFQQATIGDRHFAWLNGKRLGSVNHPTDPVGGALMVLAEEALIDRYEYLDLDGLPDAEALKMLGIDTP